MVSVNFFFSYFLRKTQNVEKLWHKNNVKNLQLHHRQELPWDYPSFQILHRQNLKNKIATRLHEFNELVLHINCKQASYQMQLTNVILSSYRQNDIVNLLKHGIPSSVFHKTRNKLQNSCHPWRMKILSSNIFMEHTTELSKQTGKYHHNITIW